MAEAKTSAVTKRVWDDGKKIHAVGTLAIEVAPATYTAGGIAFDFLANLTDGAGLGLPLPAMPSQPFYADIEGTAYKGQYLSTTKKLKIFDPAGVEVAAGAVPAGLSNDAISFYIIGDKLV